MNATTQRHLIQHHVMWALTNWLHWAGDACGARLPLEGLSLDAEDELGRIREGSKVVGLDFLVKSLEDALMEPDEIIAVLATAYRFARRKQDLKFPPDVYEMWHDTWTVHLGVLHGTCEPVWSVWDSAAMRRKKKNLETAHDTAQGGGDA